MTKIITLFLALIVSSSVFATQKLDGSQKKGSQQKCECMLRVQDNKVEVQLIAPWVRPAKKGQNSVGFVQINNTRAVSCKIIRAMSPVAKIVELHTSFEEKGIHKMRPLKSIEIGAHGNVELKPGGKHIMLLDLRHDLKEGDQVPITLELDSGETIKTTFNVSTGVGPCCRLTE